MHRSRVRPYAELRASSAFSFLRASSSPEELVARAAHHGLEVMALVDVGGVYGAPRFHRAARAAGLVPRVGAEVTLEGGGRLTLLAESRTGYRNLCKLITSGALAHAKGEGRVGWELVEEHAAGLRCLSGGAASPLHHHLRARDPDAAHAYVDRLVALFPGRVHVEVQRHRLREEAHLEHALRAIARRHRLPAVATNGVRYASPADKDLLDVLTCIRHRTQLDAAARLLDAERERGVRGAREMSERFADWTAPLDAAYELAGRLDFTLEDLGYRFPAAPLPPGETPGSYLRHLTWSGARARFRPLTARAQAQIERELAVIEKLDLAGYFLIVWDIVRFCLAEGILVQGRGSAANSAVCYALSITAVDPVKMGLLFERFLSEERGEWPDIDLDLPSGDQRERVIQYVYRRYGARGAAMTANVISYRDRSAARELGKVLGWSAEQVDAVAKRIGRAHFGEIRDAIASLGAELAASGLDPDDVRARHFARLWPRMQHLPRHLGQHSGGMVVAAGRLDEVVPLEPASMPGRVVVQWDKDDCADLGIVKVDLLGLGMMKVLEEAVPLIARHEGVRVDLAHLPADDPTVYEMLNRADTVGVFQVESRAQMASLPRNAPRTFYDLVVQVAIIRPGPIVGGMVHPYFERRQGREAVDYLHPSLEPILERTLGVPIFQEQVLRMAMETAGFTGGEAEELRRAMGFKRSVERMQAIHGRLRKGMSARGIEGAVQEKIIHLITSFAMYGFPESHAASFALLAYASAYLKAHHPTAFYVSLLNAWPMGFYHPATLVKDAERHGVEVRPADVTRSSWGCDWEDGAVRVGLRYVKGLRAGTGRAIEEERRRGSFEDVADLERRVHPAAHELEALARVGALAAFGLERRAALWQVAKVVRGSGPLFDAEPSRAEPSPLPVMSAIERSVADYLGTGLTTGPHFMAFLREELTRRSILPTVAVARADRGTRLRIAGGVIVRQRPGTAKGVVFLTLEDETGMAQAIVHPGLFARERVRLLESTALVVAGRVERRDGSASLVADEVTSLGDALPSMSRDFH